MKLWMQVTFRRISLFPKFSFFHGTPSELWCSEIGWNWTRCHLWTALNGEGYIYMMDDFLAINYPSVHLLAAKISRYMVESFLVKFGSQIGNFKQFWLKFAAQIWGLKIQRKINLNIPLKALTKNFKILFYSPQ